jgi:hypothetical protein
MRVRVVAVVVVLVTLASAVTALVAPPAEAGRTFGDDPLDEVLAAAEEHKACGLSRDKLAAMVIAPTARESGAPATEAPSPMTLSRWDNQSALYSFGSRTSYPQAFWHPGISPWQWDDASLYGHTASQRINSEFIADFTAEFIADRWCRTPSFSSVWAPWFGCDGGACTDVYNEIYQNGHLVNVTRDATVSNKGGMVAHTCTNGGTTTFTCWFIDPSKAQGYDAFAEPNAGPAPITAPFYSFSSNGREYRHWLRDHTGYSIDIQASLLLGQNSRTSLTWVSGSSLCDLTTGDGVCDPSPPAGFALSARTVSGSYDPVVGDFDGDGRDDVLWYGAGANPDALWYGTSGGSFTPASTSVGGTYTPIPGDFDGDGRGDILWYGPGANPDSLWYGRSGGGFTPAKVSVRGTYTPIPGDFDGDGRDDVFWYGPGANPDSLWFGRTTGWKSASVKVSGHYAAFSGNFDGLRGDDVFWYAPGSDKDSLWKSDGDGTFTPGNTNVNGDYLPVPGDFSDDGRTDVLWYGEGGDSDSLWYASGGGAFTSASADIDEVYQPFAGDFDGKQGDDLFWYRPGPDYDAIWFAQ